MMTFEEWAYEKDKFGQTKVSNAWYALAQEFQSGDTFSQDDAIAEVMRLAWDARYHTLKVGDV